MTNDAARIALTGSTLESSAEEVTRLKEALRESERTLYLVVDNIPGLVALLTADGDVQFVNRQILEYTGQTLEELKALGHERHRSPRGPSSRHPGLHTIDRLRQPIRDRAAAPAVGRRLSLVPEQRLSASRCKRPYRALVRAVDGHRRTQTRRGGSRASERNLKLIIDTMPALAWSARPDGSAEFFNQHYLDFIGLSAEQASGWGWTAAVHPEDLNGLAATWQRIMASEAAGEAEARLTPARRRLSVVSVPSEPAARRERKHRQVVRINTDIEDRKRAEAELRRAYDQFLPTPSG